MSPKEVIENREKSISKWKDIIGILHSIFVILAIIGAGYWFFKQGEIKPRADISHLITHRDIHKDYKWVHVLVNIKNIGKTPIVINKGNVWVQRITPLTDKLEKDIDGGVDIINRDLGIVSWPNACNQDPYKLHKSISIEPGETQPINYEFIIHYNVTAIKVYSYFDNPTIAYSSWKTISIYHMK